MRRVLRPDGLLFLNLGDGFCSQGGHTKQGASSQRGGRADVAAANAVKGLPVGNGLKNKDLCMTPARVAIALIDDGWYLRNDIIWHRKNAKPESVTDRFSMDYEHVFMLSRSPRYYFDQDAVREAHATPIKDQVRQRNTRGKQAYAAAGNGQPMQDAYAGLGFGAGGRNRRSVWSINTQPTKQKHFATFPETLVEIPLRASTSQGGACSNCGSPRVRVTIKGEADRAWQAACGGSAADGTYNGQATKDYAAAGAENASAVKARILEGMRPKLTIGWRFVCQCHGEVRATFPRARCDRKRHQREISGNHRRRVERHLAAPEGATVPCRVLDCFAGSGTTLAVAYKLGLDAVGIDLQAEYAQLGVERVAKAGGVLEVIGLERPEIRELLAAAAERPTLLHEIEWEGDGVIEESSGWIDDIEVQPFTWAEEDRG